MDNYKELNKLKNLENVALICHRNPDADALSSMIVFKDFLLDKMNISNIDIFSDGIIDHDRYQAIIENNIINPTIRSYDAAITLDSASIAMIGQYSSIFSNTPVKINIDHHKTNQYHGDINIVDFTSSTCQIVYFIAKAFSYTLSKEQKGKLYAGLITDSNNFSVGEMNSETFQMVGDIITDIDTYAIYEHFLSTNTISTMQTLAKSINNIQILENGKIIISNITLDECKALSITPDSFNGIINKLATIANNKFVLFIYPKEDYYYVSMRAKKGYDVSIIASRFGGGGHKGAAAFESNQSVGAIINMVTHEFVLQLNKDTNHETSFKF